MHFLLAVLLSLALVAQAVAACCCPALASGEPAAPAATEHAADCPTHAATPAAADALFPAPVSTDEFTEGGCFLLAVGECGTLVALPPSSGLFWSALAPASGGADIAESPESGLRFIAPPDPRLSRSYGLAWRSTRPAQAVPPYLATARLRL